LCLSAIGFALGETGGSLCLGSEYFFVTNRGLACPDSVGRNDFFKTVLANKDHRNFLGYYCYDENGYLSRKLVIYVSFIYSN